MKKIEGYIPFVMIAAAVVAGVYFFWYKPKKDAEKVVNDKLQSDYDKALTNYETTGRPLETSIRIPTGRTINANANVNLLALIHGN